MQYWFEIKTICKMHGTYIQIKKNITNYYLSYTNCVQLLVKIVETKVSSYETARGKVISLWYGVPCTWIHQLCHPAKKQPCNSAPSHLCPIIHGYEVNIYFINVSLVLLRCLTTCACLAGLLVRGLWREWYTVFMQLQFQLPTLKLQIPYTIRKIDVKNNEFYKRKFDPCLTLRLLMSYIYIYIYVIYIYIYIWSTYSWCF